MDIKRIDKIVNKVVGGKYVVNSHLSKTSDSYYVTLINGEQRVQLRFSDHLNKKNRNSKTFIVSNSIKEKSLEGFIKNRMKMLQTVSLYCAFDKLEGKAPRKAAIV